MGSSSNYDDDQEWMEKVKSGGSVPYLDPNKCGNSSWSTPAAEVFMVRGPNYFSNKIKIPATSYFLQPLAFDWVKSSTKISQVLDNPNSRVRKAIDSRFPNTKPFLWAFNLQLPSKENYSAIAYFASTLPIPEGSLLDKFLKGDDVYRNSRLKLIANIVKGPWIVKKAVGEQAICVVGRALTCKYSVGDSFLEVDVDIGSSMVASAIVHLAFGYVTTLTVDLAFLIESQIDSELPERLLGGVRFSELNPAAAKPVEQLAASSATLERSLSTRLWKSIGQGFTHLIHHGSQEIGSPSASSSMNGEQSNEETEKLSKEGSSI